jgi:hypothetical protein
LVKAIKLTKTQALLIKIKYFIGQILLVKLSRIIGIKTSHHGLDVMGYRRAAYA